MQNHDEDLFHEAHVLEKKLKFHEALDRYHKILENNPEHMESWLNAGAIYSRLSDHTTAVKCFELCIKIRKDFRAFYNLGLEFYKAKMYSKAIEQFQECLSINPLFAQGYLLSGYALSENGRKIEAINILNAGIRKCGVNESLLICLAITYYMNNAFEECSRALKQIFQLNPENRVALKIKGMISINECVSKESIEVFRKLIHNDPEMAEIDSLINEPKNKKTLYQINSVKSEIIEKKIKTPADYLNLSLVSFMLGNGNAAMNYLLYAIREK